VDKILMCFLYVRQICRSAFYTTWNVTQSKRWYHHPVLLPKRYLLPLSEGKQRF
jgi:hypothetical protein